MPRAKKSDTLEVVTEKTEKKPTCKTSRKAKAKVQVFVEYNNIQASTDEIIENVKATYAANGGTAEIKDIKIYLKPEENAAYYVINNEESQKMDVYFC